MGSHDGGVEDVTVLPDGDWAISCGHDNCITFSDLNYALSVASKPVKKKG